MEQDLIAARFLNPLGFVAFVDEQMAVVGSDNKLGDTQPSQPLDRPGDVTDGGVKNLTSQERVPAFTHRVDLDRANEDERCIGDLLLQLRSGLAEHLVEFHVHNLGNTTFPEFAAFAQTRGDRASDSRGKIVLVLNDGERLLGSGHQSGHADWRDRWDRRDGRLKTQLLRALQQSPQFDAHLVTERIDQNVADGFAQALDFAVVDFSLVEETGNGPFGSAKRCNEALRHSVQQRIVVLANAMDDLF